MIKKSIDSIHESDIEKFSISLLKKQGCSHIASENQDVEREGISDVVLQNLLRTAIDNINPDIPGDNYLSIEQHEAERI